MVLTALGALKSGAAYQPLDPNYPSERLSFMLEDTSEGVLIADRDLVSLIPSYSGRILFTDEIEKLERESFHLLLLLTTPSFFYIHRVRREHPRVRCSHTGMS